MTAGLLAGPSTNIKHKAPYRRGFLFSNTLTNINPARGWAKMQGVLAAACQNMKKIALVQSRKGRKGTAPSTPSPEGFLGAI